MNCLQKVNYFSCVLAHLCWGPPEKELVRSTTVKAGASVASTPSRHEPPFTRSLGLLEGPSKITGGHTGKRYGRRCSPFWRGGGTSWSPHSTNPGGSWCLPPLSWTWRGYDPEQKATLATPLLPIQA